MMKILPTLFGLIFISLNSFALDTLREKLNEAAKNNQSERIDDLLSEHYLDAYLHPEELANILLGCSNLALTNNHQTISDRLKSLGIKLLAPDEENYSTDDSNEGDEGDEGDLSLAEIAQKSTRTTVLEDVEEICERIYEGELPETGEEQERVSEFLSSALRFFEDQANEMVQLPYDYIKEASEVLEGHRNTFLIERDKK